MAIGRFQKKSNENVVKKHRQTGHGSRSCRKPLTVVRRPPKRGAGGSNPLGDAEYKWERFAEDMVYS